MLSYIWPVLLIVISNTVYHICTKSSPEGMHPLASLTVTYLIGALVSAAAYFLMNRGGDLLKEYRNLNWMPILLGIAIVGLEVGYIYAYRAGWQISTASIVVSAVLALVLVFVGILLYKEALTLNKVIGLVICLIGLYFLNK